MRLVPKRFVTKLAVFLLVPSFFNLVSPVKAETVDFSLPDIGGEMHRLTDYRGKWVVVNYWATWCPPCLEEIPELEVFYSNHKDTDAVVLGVNMEKIGVEKLKSFVEDQFISYPILRSKPGPRTPLGLVPGLPTSYVVSPQGKVVARQVGPVTAKALDAYLSKYSSSIPASEVKQ